MAESFLATGPAELRGGERYQVILHSQADGRLHLDDGPAVYEQTAKRIACDASVVEIRKAAAPLSVGADALDTTFDPARAELAGPGLPFSRMHARRFVDAHHITTGPMAARRPPTTSSCSAATIIVLCTRATSRSSGHRTAPSTSDVAALESSVAPGRNGGFTRPRAGPLLTGTGERMNLGLLSVLAKGHDGPWTIDSAPWDP